MKSARGLSLIHIVKSGVLGLYLESIIKRRHPFKYKWNQLYICPESNEENDIHKEVLTVASQEVLKCQVSSHHNSQALSR